MNGAARTLVYGLVAQRVVVVAALGPVRRVVAEQRVARVVAMLLPLRPVVPGPLMAVLPVSRRAAQQPEGVLARHHYSDG
jgi:hypothetical protein